MGVLDMNCRSCGKDISRSTDLAASFCARCYARRQRNEATIEEFELAIFLGQSDKEKWTQLWNHMKGRTP